MQVFETVKTNDVLPKDLFPVKKLIYYDHDKFEQCKFKEATDKRIEFVEYGERTLYHGNPEGKHHVITTSVIGVHFVSKEIYDNGGTYLRIIGGKYREVEIIKVFFEIIKVF